MINNADRKGGHLLPTPDGHVYGVDHGVTLHVEDKLRTCCGSGPASRCRTTRVDVPGRAARRARRRAGRAAGRTADPARGAPHPAAGRPAVLDRPASRAVRRLAGDALAADVRLRSASIGAVDAGRWRARPAARAWPVDAGPVALGEAQPARSRAGSSPAGRPTAR